MTNKNDKNKALQIVFDIIKALIPLLLGYWVAKKYFG